MPQFQARLVNDQGRVVAADVGGAYQERFSPAGTRTWFGQFTLPLGQVVPLGAYRMVLDNGRSARIRVSDGTYRAGRPGLVQFQGQGPLP